MFPIATFALGRTWLALGSTFDQQGAPAGEWPTYGGDLGHTRCAPLDQIDAANFAESDVAWRLFGNGATGWQRVQAICDFVHDHIQFGSEHARDTKTVAEA